MNELKKSNTSTPFLKLSDTCRVTGLSEYFLRNGCKDGNIPHVKSGKTYYVNVPALMEKLNKEGVCVK